MEVVFFLLFFILAACAPNKTTETVFPGSSQKPGSGSITCPTANIHQIKTQFIVQWEDGRLSVETSENADLFVRDFLQQNLQQIKHVEFDQKLQLPDQVAIQAASAQATAASSNWGQQATQVDAVHAMGVKGQGVVVAIVDTPVDYAHSQLAGRMVPGWDFVTNSPSAAAPHDHATHIAGIIGAAEGGVIDGLAPLSHIMGVSFMDASGSGTLSDAIKALQYSADHGAKIINNSWGGPACSETLRQTMVNVADQGVLLMVAAGNDGADIEQFPTYPASFTNPLQLTIAASTANNLMAAFSNSSWNLVHLAAPGENIYSTIANNAYGFMSGTSMATPFASGAAALLWGDRPSASAAQVRQAILNSVDTGPFRVSTQGRLNVQRALNEIRRLVP